MAITPINFGQVAQTPTASTAAPTALPQNPGLGSKILTGAENIGKDAFNTLIGTPATRVGQLVGNAIAPALGIPQSGIDRANQQSQSLPLGLGTVPPQKGGLAGAEQIGGQALKSASYLVPGAMAEGVASRGIINGALQGVKLGAVGGGLGGAGNAMSQGANTSDVISRGISGAGTGALVGGAVGGATGAIGNIWDKVYGTGSSNYETNVANAAAANNQAGEAAVKGANEASQMVYSAKADAGTTFSEAPKTIEQTQPGLGLDLKASTADKLNALKDTKAFSLPDYLRPNSENFGNGSIDIGKLGGQDASGIKLSPTQTQDLITRLNDLQFNSKGDVVVNQQTQNLINEIKGQAQDTFGHVTDAQGNSVWNHAYQNYAQTMDAVHAAGDIVNINKTPGGMSNPVDIDSAIKKVMSLQDTPQGRANMSQFIQEFKNRTGYDLSDPIQAQTKLIESNTSLQKAIEGGFGKQLTRAMTNPSAIGRRLLYATTALIGLTAIGTAFRKQLGSFISGQ